MKRIRNASLKKLNSFGVEANADELIILEAESDLETLASEIGFDPAKDLLLGDGSNILFAANVNGRVILNRITGKAITEKSQDSVLIDACGGENWHQLVVWSLNEGLSGLENLSLIPGLAGAAPIQNIGAYGVELADVLDSVDVLDLVSGQRYDIQNCECDFGYRDSRFKSRDNGRFLINRIRLRLDCSFTAKLAYAGITDELRAQGIKSPTAWDVSNAVIRIRQRKLPDPKVIGNAGSFFKNPLVDQSLASALTKEFNGLPVYPVDETNAKISAAWLIEFCGWKGRSMGDAAVFDKHALVLVNKGNATGREILALAEAIQASVKGRFGIELQAEPRIIS